LPIVQAALVNRGNNIDLEFFTNIDADRRSILLELDALRHKRNVVSQQVADMKRKGQSSDSLVVEMRDVSSRIKELDRSLAASEEKINKILMELPNIPDSSVPIGKNSLENPVIKKAGKRPDFDFEPAAHWTLGENLKILDFNRASKITGARFPLYFGAGARLERALINFMIDVHTLCHGYTEVLPPFIVNRTSITNTGQLPKFEEDLFKLNGLDYYMIPTAEVPVTNIHQGEILDESMLPILYAAYTPCFRSEAGSYGKDTRGLIRQHQFNKVELVKFTKPENSYDELEKLLNNAEEILKRLEISYRVVVLCTGDLGFSAAKTYDIEVWMPAQGVYREISSCSNFEDFQARRANIRFKRKGKKGTELVHTDGSIIIPKVLQPYMGDMEKIAL